MASGQTVETEHPTLRLVQPRSPMDCLGPLRGASTFGSPLWQPCSLEGLGSETETSVGDIDRQVVPDVEHEAVSGVEHEAVSGVEREAVSGVEREAVSGVEREAVSHVEHVALAGVGYDAPTQRLIVADGASLPDALARRRAFDPEWRPSPRPRDRNATALTTRIRLADLLGSPAERVDQPVPTGPKDDHAATAALTAASRSLRSLNGRTLVLAGIAALTLLAGGALLGNPMNAVTIAPSAEPTSISADAPHVSAATVIPAVLRAHAPASGSPASLVSPDIAKALPSVTVPVVPARAAGSAAKSGIPGMMGTPVASPAPGRGGPHSRPSMPTALSTADDSSETDDSRDPVIAGEDARDDIDGGDHGLDDTPRRDAGANSDLLHGLVGGVLN